MTCAKWMAAVLAIFVSLGAAHGQATATAAPPADGKPGIDPQANALMRRMGDFLTQAQFFSVSAEIWQDVQPGSGPQLKAGRTAELQVRRPDRLHAEMRSSRRSRSLNYDGKSITLLDRAHNFYGSIPVPASLDEALDVASERFGITVPLEDIIVSDPYQSAMGKVTSAILLGPVPVLGVPCEHLAFSLGNVDWQIWIEDGAKPVPRKIVITYKDEVGSPQYTALLSNWDFQMQLPDSVFKFDPPPGAKQINVAEIKSKDKTPKTGVAKSAPAPRTTVFVDRTSHGSIRHIDTNVYQRAAARPIDASQQGAVTTAPPFRAGQRPFVHRDLEADESAPQNWENFAFLMQRHGLPPGYKRLLLTNAVCYYKDGIFYRQCFDMALDHNGSIVDRNGSPDIDYWEIYPPPGAVIPELPDGSTEIDTANATYYYAGGAFYVQQQDGSYLIIVTPIGVIVPNPPPSSGPRSYRADYQFNETLYKPVFVNGVTQYVTAALDS